jgi:hypothetical protein
MDPVRRLRFILPGTNGANRYHSAEAGHEPDLHLLANPKLQHYCFKLFSKTIAGYYISKSRYVYRFPVSKICWQNLETDTQQLGSIFDAQPSEIQGNIHCVSNPALLVLGYVSIGAVTQKRLFIGGSQMPRAIGAQIPSPYGSCLLDTAYYSDPITHGNDVSFLYQQTEIPINGLRDLFTGKYYAYTASTTYCVDCRAMGGTNREPFYWIYKY